MGEQPRAWAQCIWVSTGPMSPTCLELLQSLVDLGEHGAGGGRGDCVPGSAPSQLLRDLEAEGLAAIRVEGTDVDVHECPRVLVGELAAEAIDVVIAAVDGDHGGVVDGRPQHLSLFQVGRDEDVCLMPARAAWAATAHARFPVDAQAMVSNPSWRAGRRRHGDDAVLERVGGIDAVVLYPELVEAQPFRQPS